MRYLHLSALVLSLAPTAAMRMLLVSLLLLATAHPLVAQEAFTAEFNPDAFEQELNAALAAGGQPGVTVSVFANAPTDDIRRAVDAIAGATDYIAESLCSRPSRPTKLVLHLTAGFDLVFSGETGSQVEWDLEIVCSRF